MGCEDGDVKIRNRGSMGHYIQAITVPWYNACADYAVMLARGLSALGHRVTVTGGEDCPAVERARELGIETLGQSSPKRKNPFALAALARIYRRYALEQGVTAVNVHHGPDHLVWALALAGTGIPLVRSSGNQVRPNRHPAASYLHRHRTAGIIASCRTIQGYYTDGFGLDPNRIPVINGGVDCGRFHPGYPRNTLRKTLGIPEDAFLFGIIGRFSPVKGHRFFFQAARRVWESCPDAWFVVAGWDAQLNGQDMISLARDAGIFERIRFSGRQKEVRDLIASLDAGVIASVGSETVCRIAMEYQAMGIPVVGTDTNVIPEVIVHGETGYIAPAGDAEAMGAAMRMLALSPEAARKLGAAGRQHAEREYSLERFAAKTLAAYGNMSDHG